MTSTKLSEFLLCFYTLIFIQKLMNNREYSVKESLLFTFLSFSHSKSLSFPFPKLSLISQNKHSIYLEMFVYEAFRLLIVFFVFLLILLKKISYNHLSLWNFFWLCIGIFLYYSTFQILVTAWHSQSLWLVMAFSKLIWQVLNRFL